LLEQLDVPELGRAQPEVIPLTCLVPENLVFDAIALHFIVNHEALVVLRALHHDARERMVRVKHTGILLINAFALLYLVLSQNEHVIHVGAQMRRHTERVLHGDEQEHLVMAAVHEQAANVLVRWPRLVVQAVIQDQERSRVYVRVSFIFRILIVLICELRLALQVLADDARVIFVINQHIRHKTFKEMVGALRGRDDDTHWQVLMVVHDVTQQETLTCISFANQQDHTIAFEVTHVELFQFELHLARSA